MSARLHVQKTTNVARPQVTVFDVPLPLAVVMVLCALSVGMVVGEMKAKERARQVSNSVQAAMGHVRTQQKVAMANAAQHQGLVLLNEGIPLSDTQIFLACSKASSMLYVGSLKSDGRTDWDSLGERLVSCPDK
jgi:glucose uptake protein GlcU